MVRLPTESAGVTAWRDGRQAAMANQPREAPYLPSNPNYQVLTDLWNKGWLEGAVVQVKMHQRTAATK